MFRKASLGAKRQKVGTHCYNSVELRKPGIDISIVAFTQVHILVGFHYCSHVCVCVDACVGSDILSPMEILVTSITASIQNCFITAKRIPHITP